MKSDEYLPCLPSPRRPFPRLRVSPSRRLCCTMASLGSRTRGSSYLRTATMDKAPTSRRGFLRSSTAAAGAAVAAQWLRFDTSHVALAEGHGKKTHPIRLGGPVFNMPQDPEKMALPHRKL